MAEAKTFVKISLFLSSYSPLWLIFLLTLCLDKKYELFTKPIEENLIVFSAVVLLSLTMIVSGVIVRALLLQTQKPDNYRPIIVKEKENLTSEYMLYVVTYIIPFLTDDFLNITKLVALSIMMVTVGTVYIRANLYHVNPLLMLLGYRLYKIVDKDENKIFLLSKQSIVKNDAHLKINSISGNIFVETTDPIPK